MGAAQIIRKRLHKIVVVYEQDVEILCEYLRWDRPSEQIEPNIQECQAVHEQNSRRKWARELVVAYVKLVKIWKLRDVGGYCAGKVVGIGVEESDVRKLIKKAVKRWGAKLEAIEVDGSESCCRQVVWGVFTVESFVFAYI